MSLRKPTASFNRGGFNFFNLVRDNLAVDLNQ